MIANLRRANSLPIAFQFPAIQTPFQAKFFFDPLQAFHILHCIVLEPTNETFFTKNFQIKKCRLRNKPPSNLSPDISQRQPAATRLQRQDGSRTGFRREHVHFTLSAHQEHASRHLSSHRPYQPRSLCKRKSRHYYRSRWRSGCSKSLRHHKNFSAEYLYHHLDSLGSSEAHKNDHRRQSRKHGLKQARLASS